MAYRFRKNEAIPHAIQRVFTEEINGAVGQLAHSKKRAAAVHEARKSIKKIRGLLGLIRSRLGPGYKTEDRYFRRAANQLSEMRDTAVMLEVFDALAAKLDHADIAALGEIRVKLQRSQSAAPPEKQVSAEVVRLLNEARPLARSWPLENLDLDALLPDFTSAYRAGRKALKRALHHQNAESLHNFRKKVKQHWYHVRLLENVWDSDMKKRASDLRDLETWLGDQHNLDVLRERLTADTETSRDRHQSRHFMALLDNESKALRNRALEAGERLYDEKPGAFSRRLAALWAAPVRKGPAAAESPSAKSAVA
jgi:CHAD domain-containing protein